MPSSMPAPADGAPHPAGVRQPYFSVLIANHNYAHLVGRAIESVLAQDYPAARREVVVVDDGSTDDSLQFLERYRGRPGVTVVSQPNRGQTAAFAAAAEHARGEFACLLDADDTCLPDKLAVLAQRLGTLQATPDNLFLCHDLLVVDGPDGEPIDDTWFGVCGLRHLGPGLGMPAARHGFPFAVTSGMVLGLGLLRRILDQVPQWEWRQGTDTVVGHAAMLICGEVHYVQRPLGRYVVHPHNNLASLVDGRFVAKPVWHERAPKTQRFLELLVDHLGGTDLERDERIAYLARLEHAGRSARRTSLHTRPLLSWLVDMAAGPAQGRRARALATARAIERQIDGHVEVLWLSPGDAADEAPAPDGLHRHVPVPAGAGTFRRWRIGLQQARGGFIALLEPGDQPDPRFTVRHLHAQRYGAMPMLTVGDLRLIDDAGVVVHAAVMATAAQWGLAAAQVPALALPLTSWPLAPMPAVVMRRSPFLDAFFAADDLPLPDRVVGWLLCQYLLQLGGATRLAENLVDLRLPPRATPNAGWLGTFVDRHGPWQQPDLDACREELLAAYLRAWDQDRACFGEAWERRFMQWLAAAPPAGAETALRLLRRAQRDRGDEMAAYLADLLRPAPAA